jgi:cell division protein ZapB
LTALKSLSNIGAMDIELVQLENQLEQLISLLRPSEGQTTVGLHGRVAQLEAENRVLSTKLRHAAERLEAHARQIAGGLKKCRWNQLDVMLLGKEYRVSCTPETRDELLATVAYLRRQVSSNSEREEKQRDGRESWQS